MENVIIDDIKKIGLEYVDKIIKNKMTYTTPGSILYLLNGEIPSFQSIKEILNTYLNTTIMNTILCS